MFFLQPPPATRLVSFLYRHFTACSVLPWSSLLIGAHRQFKIAAYSSNLASSSGVHKSRLMLGSRCWNQRSFTCFTRRPLMHFVTSFQLTSSVDRYFLIVLIRSSSSSLLQAPLTREGSRVYLQCILHCCFVLRGTSAAILSQSSGPYFSTALRSASSSLASQNLTWRRPLSSPSPLSPVNSLLVTTTCCGTPFRSFCCLNGLCW
mmetsp:Transcript_13703/g.24458  ORF Transcript_13703/g.24458 Transcript_13703/m.24458 type:complete len:205 (-) Transcript_13703:299-913(-)